MHDTGTQKQQRDDSHRLSKGLQRLRDHELVAIPVRSELRARKTRQSDQQQAACEDESSIDPFPVQEQRHHGTQDQLGQRSEEHTSELQSLMRISYAVFCLKKKTTTPTQNNRNIST